MPRPQRNIIFFHAESWDGRMLGFMGHPVLKAATPNIDRIARQGMLFRVQLSSHLLPLQGQHVVGSLYPQLRELEQLQRPGAGHVVAAG